MIRIKEVSKYIQKDETIEAWVINIRKQGKKLCFLSLFDGTAEIQCTLKSNSLEDNSFELINNIFRGASVRVFGTIVKDERAPTGFELQAKKFEIIHSSSEEFDQEVSPDSNIDVKLNKRHIILRGPKSASVLRLQSHVLKYIRDFFYKQNCEELFPPLIVEAQAEGGSELFQIKYFDKPAYLTQSSQLYLEAGIFALRDVFCILPSFRAEKSKTKRHLTEYRHIEGEFAFMEFEGLVDFIEDMTIYISKQVVKNDKEILDTWNADFKVPKKPFPRITYDDAIKLLETQYKDLIDKYNEEATKDGRSQVVVEYGKDISDYAERVLIEHFGVPVILYNFPKHMKPFYHKIDQNDPNVTKSADFLFPICGELVGSGERETDIDSMLDRMSKMDPPLNPSEYYWYLDLRRYGSIPHSGFGMGLERLMQWILNLDSIRESTLFPRTINRLSP